MARGDPYGFGLRSKCPMPCKAWDERQLHGRNHFITVRYDDEQLCKVGVDRGEGRLIRYEAVRLFDCFASSAERIVDEQLDNGGQIVAGRWGAWSESGPVTCGNVCHGWRAVDGRGECARKFRPWVAAEGRS